MSTCLRHDRERAIAETLERDGTVVISDLAKAMGVSEMTIRRDLRRMEEEGVVNRVHGGAVPSRQRVRYGERLAANTPAKARAAAKLGPYLPTSGTIYLDGSTTTLSLVCKLNRARELQVATNNVETFQRLAKVNGVEPILIGGSLDRRTDNLVGALARRSILAIAFEAAFFSCYGLTPEHGPMEATLEDAEVKDLVASRSRAVYLAVDRQKLGRVAPGAWMPDAARTVLATDLPPADKRLVPYRNRFSQVV